jgi:hypothetical protein
VALKSYIVWDVLSYASYFMLVSYFALTSTLKMEAKCSSEQSDDFQRTIKRGTILWTTELIEGR